ncbi:hypothetical protein MIN45_P1429 [Methylomarinovum tepidoasis]|uniref:DUF1538 domain-containing protein n=1 Tax=Methylomarinovum tepidoasis TaxID=2840183 RepID=A0AAU9C742_9GAMM|nr:DUF1538 domain-containing protein [Methylomarinovum sp. IN45]BCX89059.1 hypothetical protein MIN45_P1429 [Methylomarinovum sp. IN45]
MRQLLASAFDLAPVLLVILLFQVGVVRQPLPDLAGLLAGIGLTVTGLTCFVLGLEQALFPLGESMAYAFARKGSLFWLCVFAFCLGFATTVAEPALIAVAGQAAEIATAGGLIAASPAAQAGYALGLRLAVALAVGVALVIGVLRIVYGWSLARLMILGYLAVMAVTGLAPAEIIGIAYDSGGVTTSTITVPLVTALGVGLAHSIRGRNPLVDGFGLIAFASLTPMIFVMLYGIGMRWLG